MGLLGLIGRPDLLATYHYNQYVIALTHLSCWAICSVVMGAMYQLVPVALETRLYSERLARWHFAFHVVGFVGMVWMFWRWDLKQVGHFGSVLAVGVGLFVYNIARTLRAVPRWNVVASGMASALFWLVRRGPRRALPWPRPSAPTNHGRQTSSPTQRPATSGRAASRGRLREALRPLAVMHAHAHLGVLGFFVDAHRRRVVQTGADVHAR